MEQNMCLVFHDCNFLNTLARREEILALSSEVQKGMMISTPRDWVGSLSDISEFNVTFENYLRIKLIFNPGII